MPKAWSSKDERQYEHIKRGESARGRSARVAKRIAAATVNKQRAKEGRAATTRKPKRAGGRSRVRSRSRASAAR